MRKQERVKVLSPVKMPIIAASELIDGMFDLEPDDDPYTVLLALTCAASLMISSIFSLAE